jgi:hypothetical protein
MVIDPPSQGDVTILTNKQTGMIDLTAPQIATASCLNPDMKNYKLNITALTSQAKYISNRKLKIGLKN